MSVKFVPCFLALILSIHSIASESEIKRYECMAGVGPFPRSFFHLKRNMAGTFDAYFTKDRKVAPPKLLAGNLRCLFSRVKSCENLDRIFGQCVSIDPSHPDWKKPGPRAVFFDCRSETSSIFGEISYHLRVMPQDIPRPEGGPPLILKGQAYHRKSEVQIIGEGVFSDVEGVHYGSLFHTFPGAGGCQTFTD